MEFDIRDPFAGFLRVKVERLTDAGLITSAPVDETVSNIYAIAHGGYVYSLGHVTAALAAQFCLGRQTVVLDASSHYLCSLRGPTAYTEAVLVRAGREITVYRTEIRDARGALCSTHIVTLKTVDYPESPVTDTVQTIFPVPEDTPPEPITGLAYPRLSPMFPGLCRIYNLGPCGDSMRYAADLWPHTCNLYGALHGGVLYTLADVAAGGVTSFLQGRRPVTVASDIHFLRSARRGPIYAVARILRDGKRLQFYRVDLTDADARPVAVVQMILQCVDFPAVIDSGVRAKANAFGLNDK